MFVITLRFVMIYTSINIHFLQLQIAFIDHNSSMYFKVYCVDFTSILFFFL